MEFTRYRGNLDDADHPHSDPFSDGGFYGADSEFDRDLLFFANAYQAATSFQQQQDGADVEQDDELDLGSEDEDFGGQGSESEEDAGPIPDDAFWRAPSVESSLAELSSPQPSDYSDPDPDPDLGSDSDSDSDSPASDQSRSSSESASESASPGNDSTASDDSLFVVQDHALLAHLFYSEQLYRHPERLPQSMADFHQHDLEAPRPSRLANLLAGPHRAPQRVDSPEDDELFEMEVGSLPRGRGSRGQAPEPVRVPARASVIDLTNEPDSPEEIAASSFLRNSAQAAPANLPSSRRNRANPRRQQLLGRTPSLSRSDGSILGAAPVIDLTLDDDDMEPMAPPGLFGNPRRPVLPPIRRRAPGDARRPIDLVVENPDEGARNYLTARLNRSPGNALSSISSFFSGLMGDTPPFNALASVRTGPLHTPAHNPLGNNMPNFNYRGNGYNNQGEPKPAFVPPPPARPGFGRNTAEDVIFVCPSCDEELKYDPDAERAKARPAKKARNRKDREEHHFWAVKECGHVSDGFRLRRVPKYANMGVCRSFAKSVSMTAARNTRDRPRPRSAPRTKRRFSAASTTASLMSVPRPTGSVSFFDPRRPPVSVFFFTNMTADGPEAGASRLLFRRNGGYG